MKLHHLLRLFFEGKNFHFVFVFVILFFDCIMPSELFAGRSDKAGSAGGSELMIPIGASTIGSGSSNLAFVSGVEAMYWNPAGVSRSPYKYDFIFSHMNYFADIDVEYFAGIVRVENIATFGIGAKMLSIGEIPITTSDQPDGTGETTSPAFMVFTGTFSRMITDKISFGISANYLIEKMEYVSATGIALTAGLQYEHLGGIDGLHMGVLLRNIGPKIQFDGEGLFYQGELDDMLRPQSQLKIESSSDELPSTIEIGLGYKVGYVDDVLTHWTATFQNNNYSADEYKVGIEIVIQNGFALRGGYTYSPDDETAMYLFGPVFGTGVKTVIHNIELQFDYCYRSMKYFSNSHVLSLQIGIR